MKCTNCGHNNDGSNKFRANCGHALSEPIQPSASTTQGIDQTTLKTEPASPTQASPIQPPN